MIRFDQLFPRWLAANYALLPPIVFFLSFMFCWGLFFQIDARLILVLSFSDYLVYLLLFFIISFVLLLAIFGIVAPLCERFRFSLTDWLLKREEKISKVSRVIAFIAVGGSGLASSFVSGRLGILVGVVAAFTVLLMFLLPAISSFRQGDVGRFRLAVTACLLAFSWIVMESGRFAGTALIAEPKRLYLIRLQNGLEMYAHVVMYTSTGIIYRADGQTYFSPNDALIFVRRTGMRK